MKCKVCEYEISEKNTICDRCGLDSERGNFTDPRKLQTYYKTIKSEHWLGRVILIGNVYNIIRSKPRSIWGSKSECAKILAAPKSTVSNLLYINYCLAEFKNIIPDILRQKSFSKARYICEQYEQGRPIIFYSEDDMQNHFVRNWDKLKFTREWKLIKNTDNGQYKVGKDLEIDLLAKNIKKEDHWLVIELKFMQAKDNELHQVLSYMSWVREELSKEAGIVKGWIIAGKSNKRLSLHIKKDHPDLKYFIYSFDKNKNLCLEDS